VAMLYFYRDCKHSGNSGRPLKISWRALDWTARHRHFSYLYCMATLEVLYSRAFMVVLLGPS